MHLPRIAIPEINQDVINYLNAVKAAGMEPVVISIQEKQIMEKYQQEYMDYSEFDAASYDGLLLPGGGDINPARYHQENRGSFPPVNELDELQLSVLDDFVKMNKPVLGVCRGLQLINVYFGGSLIQDLPTRDCHAATKETGDRVHSCIAERESWLALLYGTEFSHNSAHHQAIDVPGDGIEVVSRCREDGVIEAVRHSRKEIYGVQWHPERMCLAKARRDTVCGLSVFQHLCRVCGASPGICPESGYGGNSLMSGGLGL